MIDRREFILALGATGLRFRLPERPAETVRRSPSTSPAQAGMNPGPGGGDRPVTVLSCG